MYKKILKEYWGYDDFRGIQREIIESIGAGRDTLGLMPTGGGKSITFQVPALAKEGVCLVVTPLIALMKDQVQNLRRRGVLAAAIYSGLTRNQVVTVLDNCILGNTKLLYISPERLSSELFITKLKHMKVSFITVDEAHCISQWGYDFRPSYLNIAQLRKYKPGVPVLALTATATEVVVDDIQERLEFTEKNVFRMSFERDNLTYVVRKTEDKDREIVHILNSVPGSAIIYTRSRKGTKDLAAYLNENNLKATFYHAGLENEIRDIRQKQWQNNEVRIMVATNAFGMGIDKPDVRMVIHRECPDSIEAYFQEAGRAGRDKAKSWAVLLYNGHDDQMLHKRIVASFPEKEVIKSVYEHLAYFFQIAMGFGKGQTFAFDLNKFCFTYKFFPAVADSALRILHNARYINYETDPDNEARLRFLLERNELYVLDNLSPQEDKVITSLLRLYGGLFIDYVYINEVAVAARAGLERHEVYMVLKALSKRHIVHFIPQRKTPYITYLADRQETNLLRIPKNVYEQRKEQLEKNIEAVLNYVRNDEKCRSRQLLSYFGEKTSADCKHCDVCASRKNKGHRKDVDKAIGAIKTLLADHKPHHITCLDTIVLPRDMMRQALDFLIHEEIVVMKDDVYLLMKK